MFCKHMCIIQYIYYYSILVISNPRTSHRTPQIIFEVPAIRYCRRRAASKGVLVSQTTAD